jgi:hypothetical protein
LLAAANHFANGCAAPDECQQHHEPSRTGFCNWQSFARRGQICLFTVTMVNHQFLQGGVFKFSQWYTKNIQSSNPQHWSLAATRN